MTPLHISFAIGQVQPAWTTAPAYSNCQPQPVTGSAATVLVVPQEDSPANGASFPARLLYPTMRSCMGDSAAKLWVTAAPAACIAVCCLQVLYPAMRSFMGESAPDVCLDAHQTLKHKMVQLINTPSTDPNFDGLLQEYMKVGVDRVCCRAQRTRTGCMADAMLVRMASVRQSIRCSWD